MNAFGWRGKFCAAWCAMLSRGNTSLSERIFQRILDRPDDSISFGEFMAMALYDTEDGYYADPSRQVGRKAGDFYTSVSVGETFGRLLAAAAEQVWRDLGEPPEFSIVEQGAHDGQLAIDFLRGAREQDAEKFFPSLRYSVIEPNAARRTRLSERLQTENVQIVARSEDLTDLGKASGLFLCNELIDALPVERVRWRDGQWWEMRVTAAAEPAEKPRFAWMEREIAADSALAAEVTRIHAETRGLPDGWCTEINLAMRNWIGDVAGLFAPGRGRWWIFDYGWEEDDYYAPQRRDGTLRCYREHRASEDPFEAVGHTDITSHVNFSRLRDWACAAGLKPSTARVVDQHDFLTHAAVDWLKQIERSTADGVPMSATDQARVRQFQTLTHPGMMGRVFKLLDLRS
jgi:SAM-dependent MidA family methyltransferase